MEQTYRRCFPLLDKQVQCLLDLISSGYDFSATAECPDLYKCTSFKYIVSFSRCRSSFRTTAQSENAYFKRVIILLDSFYSHQRGKHYIGRTEYYFVISVLKWTASVYKCLLCQELSNTVSCYFYVLTIWTYRDFCKVHKSKILSTHHSS